MKICEDTVEGDGKAFYGRDSVSNYFIIGMKQTGTDLFDVENGQVAISANAFEEDIRRSLASGMNAHLSKPVDLEKLRELLEKVLGEKETGPAVRQD